MVKAVIEFGEDEEQVVNMVKAAHGYRNKSQAVNHIIDAYTERQMKPEFIKKMKELQNAPTTEFETFDELIDAIENAED